MQDPGTGRRKCHLTVPSIHRSNGSTLCILILPTHSAAPYIF
uniref:Uncharacterized protein n=1 Tax=Anguilla anguilla TaxID=7936 RepID=A0A0E9SL47_ANGAN